MTGRERQSLVPGYVLHSRPFRDTSLLCEVLTLTNGRCGVVAKGVRGRRSTRRALLQPFQRLLISWTQRGELGTLTGVESGGFYGVLSGESFYAGCYVNELVLKLLPRDDPHPDVFGEYEEVLERLSGGNETEVALRIFEKRLLEDLGYGLNLVATVDGEPIDPDGLYRYRIDEGAIPAETHPGSGEKRYSGRALLALRDEAARDAVVVKEWNRLLRSAVDHYIGSAGLKSREVLRSVRRKSRGVG